ncbi:GNAT family N-acetyltransferase [Clostridium tagluense]|uniref:GNAT family N-acetyltransferase n=1 Tax=Clostridium tagluense TaxID=360422 RepID=UPI001C0DD236|nr:GNAT family N-acetyltransferase [Clostridium tagluense]MBU3127277.1 GNAT family N-acetyltransferase [Clostridium tagluense]
MEIKQFKIISSQQKKELYNFIKSTDLTYNKTYIEMTKIYESDTFNEGDNVFILFVRGQIKGSIAVITKEISIKGEAFITDICVERKNAEKNLCFLMETIVKCCNAYTAKNIKIGIRKNEIHLIPYIRKLEFTHIYDAVVMKHKKDENMGLKVNNNIDLRPLCILNSHEYMNIHNETFRNSPNGGTINDLDVKDYIVQYANNEDLIGICFDQNNPCGIYELSIDGNTGWVDTLGITPIYQRKGLGSALIVKCIKKLYEKNIDEIKLLVITSNDIAVNMYKRMGFEEESVFSYWFEKNIDFFEEKYCI